MTTYVALLRAVNVGGPGQPARMEDVRGVFTALGYGGVRSYIQTGNILFTSGAEPRELAAEIEERLALDLGLKTSVILRTGDDLATVAAGNPFASSVPDVTKLHVTFLAAEPDPERAAALAVPDGETAVFALAGREVYLHTPDGYGRTKLNNAFLERRLGVIATTRNWRVTTKLGELLRG
jgi:uncharacterized protein (DUF1697 family)